ncbi:MAG: hypothetical protein ABJC10_06710 [Acidobacteriota bacterium]
MAEERTIGLGRARESSSPASEESSKEELQRRMEQARDSITNTVTEIKESVAQQVESVKDALDWREHFKKQPVAWSLGAAGVGLFVGYGIAAAIKGDARDELHYAPAPSYSLSAPPVTHEAINPQTRTNGHDDGPGLLERFQGTSAYERLGREAGAIGDRLVEELSSTAQQVVLPALLKKIKGWIGLDLSAKRPATSDKQEGRTSYEPAVGRS